MEQVSSQFIAASLIKRELNKSQVKYLTKKASFYGYKKNSSFLVKSFKRY